MFQGYLCGCFKINPPEKLMLCYAFLSISKDLLGHPNVQTNLQYVHIHIIYIYQYLYVYMATYVYIDYTSWWIYIIYIYILKTPYMWYFNMKAGHFSKLGSVFFSEPPEPEPPAGCGEIYKPRWLPTVGVWYFRKVPATNDFLRISWFSVYVYIYINIKMDNGYTHI